MFPAEPVPEAIGSYKILRRLPGAGAAEVYLARAQGPMGFARECELKLMPDTSDGDASYAEELAREAAICAKLNNPAVVRVFDFFEHHGKLVLALEHVEGNSLAELLSHLAERHQKLGDQAIFYIGGRIAAALADAHAARDERGDPTPIIHRNLSPDTVLISVDGDVRLTGFGVGKILGRTPDTAIGRIKGTPGYMAPEQARGEPVTTKADVYGIGLLLWSLLAGKRPPTDGTWPRRISGLRNDLPREVAAIVDAALDHFPGTRKITAREMEQWLSKAGPVAKGKGELRDGIAGLRADAKEGDPPPPSSRRRIASVGSPYQGVRFGPAKGSPPPHTSPSSAPPSPATTRMAPTDARKQAGSGASTAPAARSRTPTVTGVGRAALHAPQDPTPATHDYVLPPSGQRPAAPAVEAPPLAGNDSQTLPSRTLLPDTGFARLESLRPAPPVVAAEEEEPISVVPASIAPAAPRPPARRPPPARPPPSPVDTPPPAATAPLLAPVLPLAPQPAPPPVEPTSTSLRFGAPPPASPAPPSVTFGAPLAPPPAPPAAALPPSASPAPPAVAFTAPAAPLLAATPAPPAATPAPPVAATPAPSSITFGAAPAAAPFAPHAADPPRRAPMPSLLTLGPGRRSLSAMGAIVVSAITATVVVTVALFLFARRDKTSGASAATSSSAPLPATPLPVATAAASARAAPSVSAEPTAADLPYGYGYLTVASPANANVFVSGKLAGPVNKPLKVRCGHWFIRLAAPQEGGRFPEWVSPGETVAVPCQEATRLDMSPRRP